MTCSGVSSILKKIIQLENLMHKILVAFILLFLAGCGYQRLVLYPNPHPEDGREANKV